MSESPIGACARRMLLLAAARGVVLAAVTPAVLAQATLASAEIKAAFERRVDHRVDLPSAELARYIALGGAAFEAAQSSLSEGSLALIADRDPWTQIGAMLMRDGGSWRFVGAVQVSTGLTPGPGETGGFRTPLGVFGRALLIRVPEEDELHVLGSARTTGAVAVPATLLSLLDEAGVPLAVAVVDSQRSDRPAWSPAAVPRVLRPPGAPPPPPPPPPRPATPPSFPIRR